MDLEEDLSLEESSENFECTQNTLLICKIVDLSEYSFENETLVNSTSVSNDPGNMDYSPEELVNRFLAEELALTQN
ncbi:hypothetical protein F8M41_022772 [Gigaspora margarita]|uniref:Uncharacterized protein n=1 Tax=Gigaspora margarita TaxID=4874 RepID=A0A8H4EHR2_GIGMA|nr:hypothetical protein F8M41_022772 [Gigaspora margarita]